MVVSERVLGDETLVDTALVVTYVLSLLFLFLPNRRFRFLETEDSPLDLIGSSCYQFMLINIHRDIILDTWRHRDNDEGKRNGGGRRRNRHDGVTDDDGYRRNDLRSNSTGNFSAISNRRFVAWRRESGCCCIGMGRLLHWIVGWIVPAIQGWLLYLLWLNMNANDDNDNRVQLNLPERIGVGIFLALELAPHMAQGFGLVLLPMYKRKWSPTDTAVDMEEKKHFIRNSWVETKLSSLSWLDCFTVIVVGIIELGIAGTAFWLGLESAYRQETFVVAILRITVALFVERLDEKVYQAWKLFATPWAYRMSQEAISDFGISELEKEE